MSDKRVTLYDSTLRDGAQTQGIDFSPADKELIAHELDAIGIDYIEGGWPGANATDDAFFANPPELKRARLTAFGMTRRAGRSADNDPSLTAVLSSPAKTICIFGKTWDFQAEIALGVDPEENIKMIADTIEHACTKSDDVMFDAEHFFDGYKANKDYAVNCLKAAYDAGAHWVVLCDTNGGTLPDEIERIVTEITQHIPGSNLGIHCHDDTGNAVANSLAAVRAGARQIQGTLNGLGERCGNANLVTLIPTLQLKMGYKTGLTDDDLTRLTHLSRMLDERLNRQPNRSAPYVGESAFAHKGGVHASAVEKNPATYEHIEPEKIGNRRHIVVSDQSGRSNILARFRETGIDIDPKDKRVAKLVETVKEQEFNGYAYDGADMTGLHEANLFQTSDIVHAS
ncbi:MAG TPA: citramalate synthase, partial [Rhodospirillales bacterium]|nr:citramalate synthase [Rhodospirillales bacterium]